MSFARKVWRLLVGIKDGLSLAFLLLFFWALFAVLNSRPSPAAVRDGALLLELSGTVVEEVRHVPPIEMLLAGSAVPSREFAARDVVRAIDEGAKDKRVKAIALDLSSFLGGGHVHMQEIGEALDRFRAANKPVLAYAVAYSDDSMLLAAHASEVWVDPMGGAAILGPGGERAYYAGLLERLNINAHVYRVGTYKSAVEPYIRNDMSPEARENAEALYGSLWQEWQANVKRARPAANIDLVTQDIAGWIFASGGNLAQATLQAGLADKVGDRIAWGERIAQVAGEDEWDDSPGAFASTEFDTWLADIEANGGMRGLTGGPKRIGVVTIAGEISDGTAGPGSAGADRIVGLLDEALEDDLAALVVRVDSPGGTVTGSEAIRRAILRHKVNKIPIAVSMGNVAASGGYWVATPGDRIFAEPETITGSIGIFGVIPTFEGLLADYGVTTDGVKTTPLSGQPDLLAGFTPETEALLQSTLEFEYGRFLSLVATSRKISRARADELGQGRVWDGGSARQLGLVDQFGDLQAALDWAAAEAGLGEGEWEARYLSEAPDPWDSFLSGVLGGSDAKAQGPRDVMGFFASRQDHAGERLLADLDGLLAMRGLQARCLECPSPASAPRAGGRMLQARSLVARLLFD
ncbi:MAG: signal peptide peptidase SppA [Croceibacterium sp.]